MTDSPVARTWEPTMRLRWRPVHIIMSSGDIVWATMPGTHRENRMQLQQQWRCLETHETEWRPIEVEP